MLTIKTPNRLTAAGAVLVLTSGLMLFGFGAPAVAAEPATVRIGIAHASSDAPFFIAEKRGYFEKEGIRPAYTPMTNMVPSLGTGQLDVGGVSTSAGLYNAVARGITVKIVADKGSTPPHYDYQPILVRKDLITSGKVKTWADFKGLKLAGFSKGSASESTLNEAMKKGGMSFTDLNMVYMPFPEHVLALQNGAIDASITTEPSATKAVDVGAAVRFTDEIGVYPNHQLAVLLYGSDFITKSPDVAKRFMRAYMRAARDYNDAMKGGKIAGPGANEVIAVMTESTNIKDPEIYRKITPNGINPNGLVNMDSLRKDLTFYKERGLIEGKVEVEDVVDNSYVEGALKELGPYKAK